MRLTARNGNDSLSVTNEIGNLKLMFVDKTPEPIVPIYNVNVTTTSATNIFYQLATIGGTVSSETPEFVLNKGFCRSKSAIPTISNSVVSFGPGTGAMSYITHSMDPGTTYFYRAYAATPSGVVYGEILSFKTVNAIAPVIETKAISNTTSTTVTSGGNIIDYGGEIPTIGLCYSESINPTILDNVVKNVMYENSFTTTINGLSVDTEYNIRAFAYNSVGISYGQNIKFRTLFPDNVSDGIGPLYITGITESSMVAESNIYPLILNTSLVSDKGAC